MSTEDDELERKFKEDLEKAIALSLQATEYEKLKTEQRKQSLSQIDGSITRSTSLTLAPRPRPGAKIFVASPNNSLNTLPPIYSQVKKNLPPPPVSNRKQSVTNPNDADLISFCSPTKVEAKSEFEALNTPSNRHAMYPDLQMLLTDVNNHSASNYKPSTSFGINNSLNIDCAKTEPQLPYGNAYQRPMPNISSEIGFRREVMPRNAPFLHNVPQLTNSPWGEYSGLDVLKTVAKRDNNNLIDLAPRLPSLDSHTVLEVFDPLAQKKPPPVKAPVSVETHVPEKAAVSVETHVPVEAPVSVETYDGQLKGSEGSIYDTYDPFDYMISPTSLDGSQGEPIYSAVDEKVASKRSAYGFAVPTGDPDERTAEWIRSGLVFDPKRIVRPIGLVLEPPKNKGGRGSLQVEKVDGRRGNAQLEAFCQMVTELRSQFVATDKCSNAGLVHAATVDCTYSEGTTVKLVVSSAVSSQPVTFISNLSSSVDHVISHVVVTLESNLPSTSASDFVLKIDGMAEYLVSDTLLGDYEYLHQCIKLDEDVALSLVYMNELNRPLARSAQDDVNDLPILPRHLLPNEPLQPISYDTMVILLETLEKEMSRVVNAAREMSSQDKSLMPRLQPNGVVQAVKAICSVLGEIETVDITEALEKFKSDVSNFIRRSDITVTADHGPYSTVVVNSPLEDSMLSHCDKISAAILSLIEAYCKAFNVDFKLVQDTPPNSMESRSISEFQDPVLVLLCEVNRLDPDWRYASFMFEVQMYHGTRPIRAPHRTDPCFISQSFYHRIAFNEWTSLDDIPICSLPREARLVFVLFGLTLLPPDHELSRNNPGAANYSKTELGWSAIQCFDHDGNLTQGSFLLSLWPVMADKRMGPAPEPGTHPVSGHPVIRVFLPQYGTSVHFPPLPDVRNKPVMHDISSLDQDTQEILMGVSQQDTFTRGDVYDREILWEKRHYLHNVPQALPKVLLAATGWDFESLSDLHAMVYAWKQMDPLAALQLLLPCFPDSVVRSLAVTWLRELSNDELADYLPQLVQALKNETYENNPLARFLLERSLISPRVAHHLFWLLVQNLPGDSPQNSAESVTGESDEAISYRYHRRLRILLRALWAVAGEAMRQRFTSQQCLVKSLYDIAQHLKIQKDGLRLKSLHDELRRLDYDLEQTCSGLPLSASATITGVDVENCGYFPTKTLPLKLRFFSAEEKNIGIPAIFKVGDPLQQDMLTLQMIRIMDKMWLKEGLDLKIVTFGCVPTGYQRGMIELVKDAETLKNIQTQNGLTGCFKDRPIAEWLEKHNPGQLEYESAVRNFTASCAGYTVATYVLGICDRHNDNIMLKKSGHLFHIDFGKFLGDAQMFLNFKRDRAPFVLTSDMAYVINGGDRPSQRFQHFVDLCCNAFAIIRKNSGIILNLLGFMVSAGIPGVTMDSLRYVQVALLPGKSKPEASATFARMIDTSLKAWFTQFNFFIHSLAQMRSDKDKYSGELFSFAPKKHTCEEDGRIIGVEVCKAQKRYDSEKYYVYIIRVERFNQPDSFIFRTYSELCELHQKLCTIFPLANLHSLPDGIHIGRSNIKMVAERRMLDVKEFLVSLFSMADEVAHSDIVYTFFHPLLRDQEEVNFNADKLKERSLEYGARSNLTGQILLSLQYQPGIFTVMIHHVRDLSRLANGQKPSTYVKAYLLPDPDKSTKRKTKVVRRNCNPSFMENLVYRMSFEVVRHRTLEVTVWNYDSIQENEFLGSFLYPLENFTPKQEIFEWFPLGSQRS